MPTPGALLEQLPRLVGLVERAGDDHRVRGGLELLGQPPRRVEGRLLGQAGADLRELEEGDRAGVHGRAGQEARGPLRDGLPATVSRHGIETQGSPANAMPTRGRGDDLRGRLVVRARLETERRRGIAQGGPCP